MARDPAGVDTIRTLQGELQAAGVPTVLGGSALLASLGLTDQVRDWDLVTDAEPSVVQRALEGLGHRYSRLAPTGVFRSAAAFAFDVEGASIDLIVQFAIAGPAGLVRIPAGAGATWQGLTMARPQDWAAAYALMGRPEKAAALEGAAKNE